MIRFFKEFAALAKLFNLIDEVFKLGEVVRLFLCLTLIGDQRLANRVLVLLRDGIVIF